MIVWVLVGLKPANKTVNFEWGKVLHEINRYNPMGTSVALLVYNKSGQSTYNTLRIQLCPRKAIEPRILLKGDGIGTVNPIREGRCLDS